MSPQNISCPTIDGIPVIADADVVVIGAGPGGFAAALRARREGCSVVIVEKFDMPGGVHTSGLQGAANAGVGGIHSELMARLDREGCLYTADEKSLPDWAGNPLAHYDYYLPPGSAFQRTSFNPDGAGNVMLRMLDEAGVQALYGAAFVDVVMAAEGDGRRITHAIVETVEGRRAIAGRLFVEGTGTSEVVARAGAPFVRGGGRQPETVAHDGQSRPVPGGLLWIMGGIDFARTAAYQKTADDPRLERLIARARAAGDIPPELYRPRLADKGVYGDHYIGHPTVDMSPIQGPGTFILWQNVPYEWALHMDDDAEHASRAKRELRRLIDAEAQFLRKYVPGFENAFIAHVGRYVGVRDGRHPLGEYVFSMDDAREERRFADAVTRPMTKTFFWDAYAKYSFEVPYRCFLPREVNNLLLTGASLSFTFETIFMVMRNFPWCTQTGEVAGLAAARCIREGVGPKQLAWTEPLF
ncbi:FAD-dependent oxidoreductase [Pseudacidovorax sp. RU35E]|uniref:FAD-dependent oxidoreductase n=1 Tax=Pseudacidovorax sp. RU35E TaxID=1907403 RepID=UPI0009555009|nr:FAD-dependent oxidoreductase [Pseudacidovorax sp. RU35E]SIP91536.1 FAD dependent oxidoreductase [Pseudacidovorax sp. RU35E]